MSYQEIVDFIYNLLTQVEGIGKVYKYERWVIRESDFANIYTTNKIVNGKEIKYINGWEITRSEVEETIYDTGENWRKHHFIIRGFYGVDDQNASSLEFQYLIEAILEKLRSAYTREDVSWFFPDPPRVNFITTIMFGNYLVHTCEIEWVISELLERR